MKYRFACCASLAIFMTAAAATDMYRWVDENGRTHFADTVPEKYRKTATKLDARRYELTAEPPRKTDTKEQTPATGPAKPGAAGNGTGGILSPGEGTANGAAASKANNDCAAQRQRYRDSQECFAPYFVKGGGIKAEAFEKCGQPVADPAPECGLGTVGE